MTRPILALPLLLLAACGSPTIPGRHTMACVNVALGTAAPPPLYVQVARSDVPQPYDARFSAGTVYLTRAAKGAKIAAHEATRQAIWFTYQRQPTPAEFAAADRLCGRMVDRPMGKPTMRAPKVLSEVGL